MEIRFFWNGNFVGTSHEMVVDGKKYHLLGAVTSESEAEEDALRILKENYGIEYDKTQIKWVWGGRL